MIVFIVMSKLCNIHCNNHVSNEFPFTDNNFNSIHFKSIKNVKTRTLPTTKPSHRAIMILNTNFIIIIIAIYIAQLLYKYTLLRCITTTLVLKALERINSYQVVPIYYTWVKRETLVDKMPCLKAYSSRIWTHSPLITGRECKPLHHIAPVYTRPKK